MSRHYGIALGFFTPLIMLMTELADPADPWMMLIARGFDTVIGVVAQRCRLFGRPRRAEALRRDLGIPDVN